MLFSSLKCLRAQAIQGAYKWLYNSINSNAWKRQVTDVVASSSSTGYMFQQYLSIKEQYKDCLLLFQVGGFYELYNEDARIASSMTELFLSRNKKMGNFDRVDLAGFPIHVLDVWLAKFISQGLRVAVCNQTDSTVSTSRNSKLVHRHVVQVATPGTYVSSIQEDSCYLMAICKGPADELGMSWVDISTGDCQLATAKLSNLGEELARINPVEVLVTDDVQKLVEAICNINQESRSASPGGKYDQLSLLQGFSMTKYQGNKSNNEKINNLLKKIVQDFKLSIVESKVANMLFTYLCETKGQDIIMTLKPKQYFSSRHMSIDPVTRRSLELLQPLHLDSTVSKKATLFSVLDATVTSAGRRLLKADICSPLTDVIEINQRLDFVNFFFDHTSLAISTRNILKRCGDVERLVQAFSINEPTVMDIIKIANVILNAEQLYQDLKEKLQAEHSLHVLIDHLHLNSNDQKHQIDYLSMATHNVKEDSSFPAVGFDQQCDLVRSKLVSITEELGRMKTTFAAAVKGGKIEIHKDFGYVYSIPKSRIDLISSTFNMDTMLKLTSKSSRILLTDEKLQALNMKNSTSLNEFHKAKDRLLKKLHRTVSLLLNWLQSVARILARLDVSCNLAIIAKDRDYVRPKFDTHNFQTYEIVAGRHPVVEHINADHCSFVSNDCMLHQFGYVWLITGPNMVGKSTFLRQNALMSIMAQIGSFVPAAEANISIIDRLFARIGSTDSISEGRSTFMTEMMEAAYIISHATERSFVILDEIGRGTAMYDGMAIAWSVIEYLHSVVKCRCLTATHYHQLSRMVNNSLPHTSAYQMLAVHEDVINEFSDSHLVLLHKVVPGYCSDSYGIEVAEMANVPPSVISRARRLKMRGDDQDDCRNSASQADLHKSAQRHKNRSNGQIVVNVDSIGDHLQDIGCKLAKQPSNKSELYSQVNQMTPEKARHFVTDLLNLFSHVNVVTHHLNAESNDR